MYWKKTGLVCIIAAAMAIAGYGQTTKQRARTTGLQGSSGYLGVGVVGVQDLPSEMVKAFNVKETSGVLVTMVVSGEAGERAGIRQHDVILEFDGRKVNSDQEFQTLIIAKAPGTKINLVIARNSSKLNIAATLGTRPLDLPVNAPLQGVIDPSMTPDQIRGMIAAASAATSPRVGFDFAEMMPQLAAYFGVREGLLVESVDPGTPAAKAGLRAGDVITKVNGIPVSRIREVFGIVRQSGKKIIGFTVFRNKKEMSLNIEMAWMRPDPSDRDAIN